MKTTYVSFMVRGVWLEGNSQTSLNRKENNGLQITSQSIAQLSLLAQEVMKTQALDFVSEWLQYGRLVLLYTKNIVKINKQNIYKTKKWTMSNIQVCSNVEKVLNVYFSQLL